MSHNTRPTLLNRLRDGSDTMAWSEFFGCYWPVVFSYARHRGCSEHTAQEVVQDVMLTVFEKRDVFQYDPAKGRFRNWLHRIVNNRVAEQRRRAADADLPRGADGCRRHGGTRLSLGPPVKLQAARPLAAGAAIVLRAESRTILLRVIHAGSPDAVQRVAVRRCAGVHAAAPEI